MRKFFFLKLNKTNEWIYHLDGNAGHDLQTKRYMVRLIKTGVENEVQRLSLGEAESTDSSRTQRNCSVLHFGSQITLEMRTMLMNRYETFRRSKSRASVIASRHS